MICLAAGAAMPEAPWSTAIGKAPHTLWVGERGFGGMVYVRCCLARKPVPLSLGIKIRPSRGRLLKREQKQALATAKRMAERHAQGLDPREVLRSTTASENNAPKKYLTLAAALDRYLRIGSGNFVRRSHHWQGMKNDSAYLLEALGSSFNMGHLLPTTGEVVWRHILGTALTEGGDPGCPQGAHAR